MFSFLDNVPVATLLVIAGAIGAIIALANHSITYEEFMVSIGALSGGSGLLGIARAQSGKGIRKG